MIDIFASILFSIDSVSALYAILIGVLILSGICLPIPEEVTLILGGYLAYLGVVDFWTIFYVLTIGIILADIAGYCLGRFSGDWISQNIFNKFPVTKFLFGRATGYFERYGEAMVLFTRPFLGIRVAIPILAGYSKMNPIKFFVFDALGAIPWTFGLVFASYYLGSGLDFITEVREIKHAIFLALGIAVAIYAAIQINKGKLSIRPTA
ncbi:MAG: DedA family protein [Candidatus Sungbacteria bacterium]|nr:DedA family protein [Candidatus Sungbacteria bacterium]